MEILQEEVKEYSQPVDMGFNVMVARKAVKRTQKEVAAALNIDTKAMQRLEQKQVIEDNLLRNIAQFLSCDFEFLKTFSVEKEIKNNIVENNTQESTSAENGNDVITQNQVAEQENTYNGIPAGIFNQRMDELIETTKQLAKAQAENEFLKERLKEYQAK